MEKKAVKYKYFLSKEDALIIKKYLKEHNYKRRWLEDYLMLSPAIVSRLVNGSFGIDEDRAKKLIELGVNYGR